MVVTPVIPAPQEEDAGGLGVEGHSPLHNKFEASLKLEAPFQNQTNRKPLFYMF